MSIGAIETRYAGHLFRSRLEARWAVFFDALKVEWQYEPQGFEASGRRYLPDFFLPTTQTWVEVKGDPEGLRQDFDRLSQLLMSEALPGMRGSADRKESSNGLLILGAVPQATDDIVFHPILQHGEKSGLNRRWLIFLHRNDGSKTDLIIEPGASPAAVMSGLRFEDHLEESRDNDGWLVEHRCRRMAWLPNVTEPFYARARQARFEHGESGSPPIESLPPRSWRRVPFDPDAT